MIMTNTSGRKKILSLPYRGGLIIIFFIKTLEVPLKMDITTISINIVPLINFQVLKILSPCQQCVCIM